jgi:hypothetical protein
MTIPWEIEISDAAGTRISEGVTDPIAPQITEQRRGGGSLTFGISAQHAVAGLIDPDAGQLASLYRVNPDTDTKELRWHGPIWAADETLGGGGIVQVTVADVWARLDRRFTSAAYTATDQGQIVKGLIDTANADGETGIDTSSGTVETTVARDRSWEDARSTLAEAILAFTDLLDPVDVYFTPIAYASGKIAELQVLERRGSTTPQAVFGYGTGTVANLQSLTRGRTLEGIGTRVVSFGEGGLSVTLEDATQLAALGLYVRDETHSGVTVSQTLQDHGRESLDHFKTASRTLSISPIDVGNRDAGVPMLWDDFEIGDVVAVQAIEGSVSFTEEARVESCTVGVVGGVETVLSIEVEVWND